MMTRSCSHSVGHICDADSWIGGDAPIASEALVRIASLYAIKKTIRGKSGQRARGRTPGAEQASRARARDLVEQQLTHVSGKSMIAEVIRCCLNHRDGRIELDTNIVERGIRPIVLNRQNALFAGHDQGAENWARIATLIETCKLNGVDPQAYFTDVLTKLVNLWPAARMDELMPWAWASANRIAASEQVAA
jgi:transposase